MATLHTKAAARAMMAPAVIVLLIWMIVPLAMTLYFSTLNYTLYNPLSQPFVGFENYSYFLSDPTFLAALGNTLVLVLGVLAIGLLCGLENWATHSSVMLRRRWRACSSLGTRLQPSPRTTGVW